MSKPKMTPEERGIALAKAAPPITEEQVEETVRILASVMFENRHNANPATARPSTGEASAHLPRSRPGRVTGCA